eukprot:CAMPEP_0114683082 /NCGR_PEP_ID=MMETSP0191-20121206/57445_1 /TAXON_ID=126664 /ORGANISM="Sorites sp." /LENGTH=197 /DNA_ID=CAMNT_0001963855 /DNA_START=33 /DNA_END=626 /DNA_ORIENTATION=+
MGGFFSKIFDVISNIGKNREMRILMLGLDAAGKTTILYKLQLGEVVHTIPTIGFNVESVEYKNIKMTMWDVGGQLRIRPLWRHYYRGSDALIFVVDSNDTERIDGECPDAEHDNAKIELHRMMSEAELENVPVLVYANKQDLPQAISVKSLAERLDLSKIKNREWHVQGCCAVKGEGLYEGLDWLSNAIDRRVKAKK